MAFDFSVWADQERAIARAMLDVGQPLSFVSMNQVSSQGLGNGVR